MHTKSNYGPGCMALAVALGFAAPQALAAEHKGISTAGCQAYGPGTVAADLRVSQNAIYNPGTVFKQVICPVNKDYYGGWPQGEASLMFYFKTGSIAGRVYCTAFVGSPAGNGSGTYTNTGLPELVAANTNASGFIALSEPTPDGLDIENVNVICTLTPKTYFAGFFFVEPTDSDGAAPMAAR